MLSGDLYSAPSRRKAALILLVGGYVNIAIVTVQGLLLIPLYIHFIGARLYGLWLASGGVLAWLSIFDMGLATLIIQRVSLAYGKKDFNAVGRYAVTGTLVYSGAMAALLLLAGLLSIELPILLKATMQEAHLLTWCFFVAAASLATSLLATAAGGLAQGLQRPLFGTVVNGLFSVLGLGATAVLLFAGLGLWALPLGLLVRNVPLLMANVLYGTWILIRLGSTFRFDAAVFSEFLKLSPFLVVAQTGYSLVNQIEPTLIAVMIRPELATVFVVTRRVADVIRLLLDRIPGSVFAGFSHVFIEGGAHKAAAIFREVNALVISLSLILLGTYVASNENFLRLWVGPTLSGGRSLTMLLAAASFALILNNFLSYLLWALGDVRRVSVLLFTETIIRFGLMTGLLICIGINGLPLAIITTSGICCAIVYRWLRARLGLDHHSRAEWARSTILFLLVFAPAILVSSTIIVQTWFHLVLLVSCFLAYSFGLALWASLPLRAYFGTVMARISRICISDAVRVA